MNGTSNIERNPSTSGNTVSMGNLSQSQTVKARQRQQLIDNLSAMVDVPEILSPLSSHQLEVKLSILERQCDTFENLQSSLELLDVTEFDNSFRMTFESLYYQAKVMLKEKLDNFNNTIPIPH